MKREFLYLLGLSMIVIIYSCQKSANTSPATPVSNNTATSTSHHGMGAVLSQAKFQQIRHIDFEAVRQQLIRKGYSKVIESTKTGSLPSSIILTHPAVGDQGQTGTCVSWSSGWALSGTLNNEFPVTGVSNPRSGWYVYQVDHSSQGDCDPDDGMYVTGGLDILVSNGVPAASLDASLGSPCNYPSATQNNNAATDRITNYGALSTVADVKTALSMHLPVEMGFNVYSSFETAFNNGTIFKRISGSLLGGHAICIIGYDDSKNAVLIQNSWGTSGGDATYPGCMWLDYSTLTNSRMGIELYSVWR